MKVKSSSLGPWGWAAAGTAKEARRTAAAETTESSERMGWEGTKATPSPVSRPLGREPSAPQMGSGGTETGAGG